MISGQTLYIRVQNLTAPLKGTYLGPSEGLYKNCPNILLSTPGGLVKLQGTSGLNRQFSELPLNTKVTITFCSKQEFIDKFGHNKEFIEALVEPDVGQDLGLSGNKEYMSQKELSLFLNVPTTAMFQLQAFGFINPTKEGNASFYKRSDANALKTISYIKNWMKYYGENSETVGD